MIFDSRVPMVPGSLDFLMKEPHYNVLKALNPWIPNNRPKTLKKKSIHQLPPYFGICLIWIPRMDLSYQGGYGSGPLEFFYKRTPANDLRALKAGIQKNIPNILNKYSIHRLSPYFSIISYEFCALIFNSRVPMVLWSLDILMKEPYYNVLKTLKAWIPNIRPKTLKKNSIHQFITEFFICLIWIPRIGLRFQGSYGSRPLEFFYERTSDNVLRALKARIQMKIPITLKEYSINRLSP